MPAFIGGINIENVGDGAFTVGDAFRISPSDESQTTGGAGAFNSGDSMAIWNKRSTTILNDPDIADQFSLSIQPFLK